MEKILEKATLDLDELYYKGSENLTYDETEVKGEAELHKKLYTLMSEEEANKLSDEISDVNIATQEFGYRLGFKQAFKLFKEVFQDE